MDVAIYVIFGLIFVGSVTVLGLGLNDFVKKEQDINNLFKGKHRLISVSVLSGALSFLLLFLPLMLLSQKVLHTLLIGFGSFFFALALLTFGTAFVLHYYKFNVVKEKWVKESKIVTIISAILSIIFLFVLLEGLTLADIITFPLSRGIPFGDSPVVAFYAIFILTGALLVLAITDHEFYKKYGRHGILENGFYVAFPAGIVGARIWYVIGEWNNPESGFAANPWTIFAIRDGGLAIMGGALFGIIAGVWFYVKRRKEYDIGFGADVIIPTILVAQAIGRWGNFFNQEVYGGVITDISKWWFLPEFIKRQMFILGEFRQPFFLIESALNLIGYFVIRFAIGEGLKKYRKPFDMAFMYIVWYGLVRFIMEPLRDPMFRMGAGGKWSQYNALIFFVVGIVLIVLNHIFDFHKLLTSKKGKAEVVSTEPSANVEKNEE
ncbi:MAG: Prolipoprotein diacylglyceryl transferase [Tenericutes bacterium ADurb.Bin087]|nr:MAG: Prolipoprotein diacylglyceryl transferase [Tenericutes bacterium ADurb.Bin087]